MHHFHQDAQKRLSFLKQHYKVTMTTVTLHLNTFHLPSIYLDFLQHLFLPEIRGSLVSLAARLVLVAHRFLGRPLLLVPLVDPVVLEIQGCLTHLLHQVSPLLLEFLLGPSHLQKGSKLRFYIFLKANVTSGWVTSVYPSAIVIFIGLGDPYRCRNAYISVSNLCLI